MANFENYKVEEELNEYDEIVGSLTPEIVESYSMKEEPNEYDEFVVDVAAQNRMRASVEVAVSNGDSVQASNDLKIARQYGVRPSDVDTNALREDAKVNSINYSEINSSNPVLKENLLDPNKAGAMIDDVENLSFFESIVRDVKEVASEVSEAYDVGAKQVELSEVGSSALRQTLFDGEVSFETEEKLRKINEELSSRTNDNAWYENVAQQIPILQSIVGEGLGYASGAAATSAAGAAVLGQLGPQAALPEEVVTVPAAALIGGSAGFKVGSTVGAFQLESGLAFNDFRQMTDDAGNKINQNVAAGMAIVAGTVNASLEMISFRSLANTVSGSASKSIVREAIKNAVKKDPARIERIAGALSRYGKSIFAEGSTEAVQEFITELSGNLAKVIDNDSFNDDTVLSAIEDSFSEDNMAKYIESAKVGMQVGMAFGSVGTTYHVGKEVLSKNKKGATENDKVKAMMTAAKESYQSEKGYANLDEEGFSQLVKDTVKDTDKKEFYISADGANEILNQASKSDKSKEILETPVMKAIAEQITEAKASGVDIALPAEHVLTGIAKYDELSNVASDWLTLSENSTSPAEARLYTESITSKLNSLHANEMSAEVKTTEAKKIYDQVYSQSIDTGVYSQEEARTNAAIARSAFTAIQQNTTLDPEQFASRYNFAISKGKKLKKADVAVQATPIAESGVLTEQESQSINQKGIEIIADSGVAIVPTRTSKATKELLSSKGLTVKTYNQKTKQKVLQETAGTLSQSTQDVSRAGVTFNTDNFADIFVNDRADVTSVMHEMAHTFFEIYKDAVDNGIANDQMIKDYDTMLEAIGYTKEQWADMSLEQRREGHEKIAESFEEYLSEGRSPSIELVSVFSKMKSWFFAVYQNIKGALGNSVLNDDIRETFDRLLATQEEIDRANAVFGRASLFDSAEQSGMTQEEFDAYQQDVAVANEKSSRTVIKKTMNKLKSVRSQWWKEESEKLKDSVRDDIITDRNYFVLYNLELEGTPKLDARQAKAILGRKSLPPSLKKASSKDGVDVEQLAMMHQFDSASEMLEVLGKLPSLEDAVNEEVQNRMIREHGDILNKDVLQKDAELAIHNPEQAGIIAKELEVLSRDKKTRKQKFDRQAINTQAQLMIGKLKLSDIRPDRYRKAEMNASLQADRALRAGDKEKAIEHKEQQLLAFYLYKQAMSAKERQVKGVKFARSLTRSTRKEKFNRAGDEFISQRDSILSAYEFVDVPLTVRKARAANDFVKSQMEKAGSGDITGKPDEISAEDKATLNASSADDPYSISAEIKTADVKNYKDLTVSEFDDVINQLKMVDRLATIENQLLTQDSKKTLDEWVDSLVSSIDESSGRERQTSKHSNRSAREERIDSLKAAAVTSRTPSNIIKMLDGFKTNGVAWRLLAKPLHESASKAANRLNQENKNIHEMFSKAYGSKNVVGINTLKNLKQFSKKFYDDISGETITKQTVVAMLLNWGNAHNKQRLLDGNGYSEQQALAMMDKYLTEQDYIFAKEVWAYLDTFKKESFELHKDMFGFTPAEVKAEPFMTKFGMMPGGYFPIKYDASKSATAEKDLAKQESSAGTPISARSKMGSAQERVDTVNRALDTNVVNILFNHIDETVQHITHDRALYDVGRVLGNEKVKAAITQNYGDHYYKSLTSMVKDVRDGAVVTKLETDKWTTKFRNNSTIAMLGLSVRTLLMQPLGVSNSISTLRLNKIPTKRLVAAYGRFASHPVDNTNFIYGKSEFMRTRKDTMNASISRIKNKMKNQGLLDKVQSASMIPMQIVQFNTVDAPLWMSAYEHFNARFDEDTAIKLADDVVRDAQGGGDIIDQAAAMRGGPYQKLFTNFLTFMITVYNTQSRNTNQMVQSWKKGDENKAAVLLDYSITSFTTLILPAILTTIINELTVDGDEYDDADSLTKKYLQEQASFLLGMNPLTAQFTGAVTGFDYGGPQGLAIVNKVLQLVKEVQQGEVDEGLFKATTHVIGLSFGLPSTQIIRVFSGLNKSIEERDDVGKTIKQTIFGPERK